MEKLNAGTTTVVQINANPPMVETIQAPKFVYKFEAFSKDGTPLWKEEVSNLVTTAGGNDLIDKYFKGSSYTAAWYMGLKGTGSPVAGDTSASHSGWSEITAYTSATRPAITFGTTSAKSNTASAVTFTVNSNNTVIYGAFVIANNTKGGSTGILYSATDFAASRTLNDQDTLNVTLTVSV